MISEAMQKAMNDQINAELYSAYLYLSMAAYFESISLGGFSNWMRCQALEEETHAIKFFDHICGRGGRVALQPIEGVPTEWESALAVFQAVYGHEQKVTALINGLVKIAREENDNAAINFLQWFVDEQVEEEKSADDVVQSLTLIGGAGHGVLMIDRELAARTFVMPTATAAGA